MPTLSPRFVSTARMYARTHSEDAPLYISHHSFGSHDLPHSLFMDSKPHDDEAEGSAAAMRTAISIACSEEKTAMTAVIPPAWSSRSYSAELAERSCRFGTPRRVRARRVELFDAETSDPTASVMLHLVELVALAFAPGPTMRPSVVRPCRSAPQMVASPLASTMQLAVDAPAPSPVGYFDGAPLEVIFLFVWIFGAGAVFLVKSSGLNVRATAAQLLSQVAGPSVASELGLVDASSTATGDVEAEAANRRLVDGEKDFANMSQAEKEKTYFAMIADEQKQKRNAGGATKRKKSKKR